MAIKGRDLGGAAGTAIGTYFGGTAGGSLGALAGQVLGGAFDSDEDYLTQAYDDAFRRYQELGVPPEEARPLILRDFKNLGVPEAVLEEKMPAIISKLGQYKEAAEPIEAQKSVLRKLSEYGSRGVTAEQEAANIQAQLKSDRSKQAFLASQNQRLAERGLLGRGGAEMAMMAQAASAGESAEAEERVAAQTLASQSALNAIRNQSNVAQEMRQQGLSAAQATLGAEDVMARFGAEKDIERARQNVDRINLATRRRGEQAQYYADLGTQLSNVEQQRRRDAEQRDWTRKERYTTNLSDIGVKRAGGQSEWQDRESERSGVMGRGLTELARNLPYDKIKSGLSGLFSSSPGGGGGGKAGDKYDKG